MNFKYRVSVIIPIYNSEDYLEWCVQSVLKNQGDQSDYEILLIDDGSTDSSPRICDRLAKKHKNIRVIHKTNEKLSATRNRGMREAQGKYFCFLDSDDALLPNTISEVANFFDQHYHEVDLVTYPQIDFKRNGNLAKHFRYSFLNESGVYDLKDYPYITQTRINVFSKNKGEQGNVYFDTTPGFRHEDSCYNTHVLMDKMKIGYCHQGGYLYVLNDNNITANYFYAYYIFETSMAYYEGLFSQYAAGEIPAYVQSIVLNDLSWKFSGNKLYPYHYEEEKFKKAKERVAKLFAQMDISLLMNMPNMDTYHKFYFLKQGGKRNLKIIGDSKKFGLFADGVKVKAWKTVGINIQRMVLCGSVLTFYAMAKHPVCIYEEVEVWVEEDDDPQTLRKLETTNSTYDYYKVREKIADFRRFVESWDLKKTRKIRFMCKVGENFYPARFTNTINSPFDNECGRNFIIKNEYYIRYEGDSFFFELLEKQRLWEVRKEEEDFFEHYTTRKKEEQTKMQEAMAMEKAAMESIQKISPLFLRSPNKENMDSGGNDYDSMLVMRKKYLALSKDQVIWLYNDSHTSLGNGLLQFRHDREKNDGVDRYYIYDGELKEIRHLFRREARKWLVQFGSEKHRELFMQSSLILTSYAQRNYYCPFDKQEILYVQDLWDYQVVYLQHGVLHAIAPWEYGNDRLALDKVIVSSAFEKKNLLDNYAFRKEEIIDSGMARLDQINSRLKSRNRILIAPSWRQYLIGGMVNNRRIPQREKFEKSEYYQEYQKLFRDPSFIRMLEKENLYVDFQLHPIFSCYADLFQTKSRRIVVAPGAVMVSDYKICITDFSSFAFDFLYANKPVLYFMPDEDKFRSGMHTYRQVDHSWRKGFDKVAFSIEELIGNIQETLAHYDERSGYDQKLSDSFFRQKGNHAERTYQALAKAYLKS